MDFELTLLDNKQIDIYGAHTLEVIKKEGPLAPLTDLAILTGASYSRFQDIYNKVILAGDFILSSASIPSDGSIPWATNVFTKYIMIKYDYPEKNDTTIRPVLIPYNFDTFLKKLTLNTNGTYEMIFGKYPQFVSTYSNSELDSYYFNGEMLNTGSSFTINRPIVTNGNSFVPEHYPVLRYKYKEFIHIPKKLNKNTPKLLVNGEPIDAPYYWVEVSPLTWLVDLKARVLVSKYGLISGIRIGDSHTFDGNFNNSEVKYFLDNFMAKEILSQSTISILDKNQELQDMMLKRGKIKRLR